MCFIDKPQIKSATPLTKSTPVHASSCYMMGFPSSFATTYVTRLGGWWIAPSPTTTTIYHDDDDCTLKCVGSMDCGLWGCVRSCFFSFHKLAGDKTCFALECVGCGGAWEHDISWLTILVYYYDLLHVLVLQTMCITSYLTICAMCNHNIITLHTTINWHTK